MGGGAGWLPKAVAMLAHAFVRRNQKLVDPVNYFDPWGLLQAAPENGYCPPQFTYEECYGSGIGGGGGIGIGSGGGGGGGIGLLPVDPNPRVTADERRRRQAAIVAAFAGIAKTIKDVAEENGKPETWPLFIKFLSSCASAGAAGVQLQVTYQVYNNLGQPMTSNLDGFSIAESFNSQTGNLGNLNTQAATWSRSNNTLYTNGQFTDVLEAGIGRSGTALQEFTASGWFGTQPLGIEFGSTDYNGVNFNSYGSNGINVNGVGATQGVCGK